MCLSLLPSGALRSMLPLPVYLIAIIPAKSLYRTVHSFLFAAKGRQASVSVVAKIAERRRGESDRSERHFVLKDTDCQHRERVPDMRELC